MPFFFSGRFCDTGAGNWRDIYSKIKRNEIEFPTLESGQLRYGEIRESDKYEMMGDWLHTYNASNWMTVRDGKDLLVQELLESINLTRASVADQKDSHARLWCGYSTGQHTLYFYLIPFK